MLQTAARFYCTHGIKDHLAEALGVHRYSPTLHKVLLAIIRMVFNRTLGVRNNIVRIRHDLPRFQYFVCGLDIKTVLCYIQIDEKSIDLYLIKIYSSTFRKHALAIVYTMTLT